MSNLTKDPFLAGLTCPTQGWFRQHRGGEPPTWDLRWRFFQGQEIHRLAADWSGPGVMLRRAGVKEAAEATREALASGAADRYYEATFLSAGCAARADIVRRDAAGWAIVEVKSGKTPKAGEPPSDEYLGDLAYTVMVARGAGLAVGSARLLLVNRDFRAGVPGTTLFAELDVTDLVAPLVEAFAACAPVLTAQLTADAPPAPRFIPACKSCDYFTDDCLGREIPDPVFLLPGLRGKRFEALAPYRRIANLPMDVDLTANQREVFDLLRIGEPRVDHVALGALDRIEWPARYLDFETAMPALPWHDGDGPYTTVLTQYSVHHREAPGAPPRHTAHLVELDRDGRRELIERLLADLGDRGSVMMYSSYEQQRLGDAMALFPDLRADIERVITRLFDLEPLFKKAYRHPGFLGRSSIKYVLPALIPELRYDGLAVGNGGDASGLIALMKRGQVPAMEHERHRRDLLAYCERDTLAMVRLHDKLLEVRGRP